MPDLVAALVTEVPVRWHIGRVAAINADSTISVTHKGGVMENVGVLDQYTPVVGDVVHMLGSNLNGVLAIGSNNQVGSAPVTPPVTPPTTVASSGTGTYRSDLGDWTAGLTQSPIRVGCWFYPDPITLSFGSIAQLTIRVTAQDDMPLEFVLHGMTAAAGPLVLITGASYQVAPPPVGVPTDVPLPLEWAALLAAGPANGVGVGGGNYSTVLTGSSGLLTFTPL